MDRLGLCRCSVFSHLTESCDSVVLMDELDQLVTAKQDVVYNFFNWPTIVGSKLIVIAVANTMDLPERVMSGRVRSRLGRFFLPSFHSLLPNKPTMLLPGMIRINFQPYTTAQLETIVNSRLEVLKEVSNGTEVISFDGIKFAAMKVSSISGDARRVLDICRCAFVSYWGLDAVTYQKFRQSNGGARARRTPNGAYRRRERSDQGDAKQSHGGLSQGMQFPRTNHARIPHQVCETGRG
jgi:hypothetical protein